MRTALIIVDVQNDFLPGGALGVNNGDQIIEPINELQKEFDLVVATQDWHPKKHGSFASTWDKKVGDQIDLNGVNQILWPDHCVMGTNGAEFPKKLNTSKIDKVFQCGMDPKVDSYSGFLDNAKSHSSGMAEYLKSKGVNEIFVCGIATDYCVKFTVLDGLDLGFKVHLVTDCSKGVELNLGDIEKAIKEMEEKGASITTLKEVMGSSASHTH